jgi:uncharacterized damage-inducible protein DinB
MMSASLLREFDQEMASTRRVLERIPADKLDWRPHPKSRPLGPLAAHLADLPKRAVDVITREGLQVTLPAAAPAAVATPSPSEILARFDANVAAGRAAIETASDEELAQHWAFEIGGHQVFKLPRISALRSILFNHSIHHRAQLGVYLRMNDIAVPAIYGPSADEGLH